MSFSERIDSTFSDILSALRRIWAALQGALAPAQPEPVPVPRSRPAREIALIRVDFRLIPVPD